MKRFAAFLMALCLVISMAGVAFAEGKAPLKLTMVHTANENPTSPVDKTLVDLTAANLEEAVGRKVEVEWLTFPTDQQTINQYVQMMNASGMTPDICYLLDLPFDSEAIQYVADTGIFHEIDAEFIRTYLPNYTRRVEALGYGVEEIVHSNRFIGNDKLYGIPSLFRADTFPGLVEQNMRQYPNYGYYWVAMRDDILKQIFPEARTAEELTQLYAEKGKLTMEDFVQGIGITDTASMSEYLRKVKALGLKVGEKDIIPGALCASSEGTGSLRWSLQTAMGIGWRWPLIWMNNLEESFFLSASEEFYKPYIKWWNEMYNEGLIDPELFIMKNDQYNAKAANGEYAVFNSGMAGLQSAIDLGKERGYGWVPFPVFYPVDYSILNNRVQYNSVRTQQIFINSKLTGDDLADAMKWVDYFFTEEADDISAWGSPDWYTGEGADRRYKEGFEDLVNWGVYGVSGEKDGKYYGITAGVAIDYTAGNNRQLAIRPHGLIQPSDGATPTAPYYVYPKDNKELLAKTNLFTLATQAGWDSVLENVDWYNKVDWAESDYDSSPLFATYNETLNPDTGNYLVMTIHDTTDNFETNWATYLQAHLDAGIREAEQDMAQRLKKTWDAFILPNKVVK